MVRLPPGRPGTGVAMNTRMPRTLASCAMMRTSLAAPLAAPSAPPGMSLWPLRISTTSGRSEAIAEK